MSAGTRIIESVFDSRLYDYFAPSDTPESRAVIETVVAAARAENRAAARRLRSIGELFEMRRAERGEEEHWAVDTWAAVGAEVAAALRISLGKAGSYIGYGLAMRRLPRVAAVFAAGDIDMQAFQTIVYRTELVSDADAMAGLDRRIAEWAARWQSMSRGRLARELDCMVRAHDPDAVRRIRERARDRDVSIWDNKDGTADVSGRLFATDAHLVDKRLDELAATVCDDDPRTRDNRRADALGALAAGAVRLMCRCGKATCPAGVPVGSNVVIHVVAEKATLEGRSERPGYLLGADSLISAELLRELAASAKLRTLMDAASAPAEGGYRPSRALADFVRARDLTCRAPGCDRPATDCDLDHTIPHADGGHTHASNLKALCRFHHILKTFWGWRDQQSRDGTVIWTLPDGQTHVTTPGSAVLFPALASPAGGAPVVAESRRSPTQSGRSEMMPLRKTTRSANRTHRIAAERAHNRAARLGLSTNSVPNPEADDPPF